MLYAVGNECFGNGEMKKTIDYGTLMHRAMRGLIVEVLKQVEREGLPGNHHFFITFDTRHPQARLAEWLRERYPEEMTIVMQHWFEGLKVDPDGFSVTLNFGNVPETLYVPLDSIRTFVDPAVEFGLRFESAEQDADDESDQDAPMETDADAPRHEAEIVSLDRFRK